MNIRRFTFSCSISLFFCLLLSSFVTGNNGGKPSFTAAELAHIRVKTPGLFSKSNRFLIEFDRLAPSDWCFPLPEAKVISAYGTRNGRSHSGTDLKTCARDTIYAAFRGVVRMSKTYSGYGKVVVIRHINGLETVYSHNCENLVKPGDRVKAGTPIALTGRTGRATTEHLHFEIRINGEHINPNIIFNMKERKLRRQRLECVKKGASISVRPVSSPKAHGSGKK